ncbi:tetratricopeptide repeat protein [Puteibacter caeruleilacunae]|nr:tetratricopeptide repeat protein [Puteibacter caeruleilacunae]
MKNAFGLVIAMIISNVAMSQNYQEEFVKFFQKNDTVKQMEVLTNWAKTSPKDAELFTSYFNYYFAKSKDEIIVISKGTPAKGEKAILLTDSTGEKAGYMGSKVDYKKSDLQMAFVKINQGIKLYPDRLDMRFGKIYALGKIKDWSGFTNEIIKTVDHSAQNKNNWTWTNNKKKKGGADAFLGSLQDYQMQLYRTGDDSLLKNMQDIANAVLKHYPNHIASLSNLSIGYLVGKEYDKALVPLLKAEKIAPKDCIVLANIAHAYKEKHDKDKALEYYQKIAQYGDNRAKAMAEGEIKKLKE